ncbi:hypothetical protein K443DRAFT_14728 [Laccaria amethystina LaAM-08-1]|uniref:Uncharacterized protein n=1 Tax=Laccaria amethystina LaAM-08-1 TaxID=1095629 RepID=A0A0C9WHE3_9AGAR|nr:hypothetical protein K443DRAFT_14728 [Laccaria amethystina LaAM-08-1]
MASSLVLSVSSLPQQTAFSLPRPTASFLNNPPPFTNSLPSRQTAPLLRQMVNGLLPPRMAPSSLDKWQTFSSFNKRRAPSLDECLPHIDKRRTVSFLNERPRLNTQPHPSTKGLLSSTNSLLPPLANGPPLTNGLFPP